jgi:hypothetical protein
MVFWSYSEITSRLDALNPSGATYQEKSDESTSLSSDIVKLRKELVDATSYLPTYDRGKYEQVQSNSPTYWVLYQAQRTSHHHDPWISNLKYLKKHCQDTVLPRPNSRSSANQLPPSLNHL